MRPSLLTLSILMLAVSLNAAPTITNIDPPEGFSYAATTVTIDGTGFGDGALTVLFGEIPATILFGTPTQLQVRAIPPASVPPEGRSVDVTVRVAGHGEAKLVNGFRFSEFPDVGPRNYRAVIVPLTAGPLPGAHGSIWESELRVFNASLHTLAMPGREEIFQSPPIDPTVVIQPRRTERVFLGRRDNSVDGHFLYVPDPLVGSAKFSLRVRDISENAGNLGVEVPVAGVDQGAPDISIVDVPVDPKYRATLRIYGFTPAPMRVGVTILPESGDTPLAQFDVELRGIVTTVFVPFPPHPAYLAIDPLVPAARAAGGRVRVELTNYTANVSPPLPNIWGFVSVTNNETNQVTVIAPK